MLDSKVMNCFHWCHSMNAEEKLLCCFSFLLKMMHFPSIAAQWADRAVDKNNWEQLWGEYGTRLDRSEWMIYCDTHLCCDFKITCYVLRFFKILTFNEYLERRYNTWEWKKSHIRTWEPSVWGTWRRKGWLQSIVKNCGWENERIR